ncbi:hypothetical protein PSPO01_16388 [Paraphaeosphaeria sporulosa]
MSWYRYNFDHSHTEDLCRLDETTQHPIAVLTELLNIEPARSDEKYRSYIQKSLLDTEQQRRRDLRRDRVTAASIAAQLQQHNFSSTTLPSGGVHARGRPQAHTYRTPILHKCFKGRGGSQRKLKIMVPSLLSTLNETLFTKAFPHQSQELQRNQKRTSTGIFRNEHILPSKRLLDRSCNVTQDLPPAREDMGWFLRATILPYHSDYRQEIFETGQALLLVFVSAMILRVESTVGNWTLSSF